MAASFLVYVPAASAAPGDPLTVDEVKQCVNGGPPSTSDACPGGWTNGALNGTNSHYKEDDVVPQRLLLNVPAGVAGTHTVTIKYQTRKNVGSDPHAFDSLATWNHTQGQADACQGLAASICSGPVSSLQMVSDNTVVNPAGPGISANTNQHQLGAGDREWKMYGATLNSSSAVTHDAPTNLNKDDEASVTLTFTTGATAGKVLLLYGGHLAVSGTADVTRAWGTGLGASAISGGPYKIGLAAIDGKQSIQESSIQAGAVEPLGPAEFEITKSVDDATATPGQDVEYTITVTNTGEQSGSTSFVDDFDDDVDPGAVTTDPGGGSCAESAGQLNCTTSSIPVDGSQTFTYTAAMPGSFDGESGTGGCEPGEFPITNTATLDGDAGSDSATVCVAAEAAFTIEKSVDPDTATPGADVEYTVTVTNNGATAGATSFVDTVDNEDVVIGAVTSDPEGAQCAVLLGTVSCDTDSIPAGDSQTFTYTVTMPESFDGESGSGGCEAGEFPVANTATLADDAGSASATVCVSASASFTIEKSANAETSTPGADVEYTITVTNTGSSQGSTTFTDDFDNDAKPGDVTTDPEGGSCDEAVDEGNEILSCETGDIPAGESQTFTYTAAMPGSFDGESGTGGCEPGEFPVTNTAALVGDAGSDSVTVCVEAAATFEVDKSAGVDTAAPGEDVEYTVTVTNTGTSGGSTSFVDSVDNEDVVIGEEVTSDPEGAECAVLLNTVSCETGDIPAGDSQTFTYTVTMPDSFEGASGGGACADGEFPVVNTVTLVGGAGESGDTVCVAAAPDFTIEKTSDVDGTATPNQTVEYTITVTNTGTSQGSTSFTDDSEDGVDPGDVTIDPEGGSCEEADGVLTCETGTIPAGDSQTFTYTADMPGSFTGESGGGGCETGFFPVTNTATLDDDGGSDSVTICVAAAPAFEVDKSAGTDTAAPGEDVEYTVTVTNTGSGPGSTSFVDTVENDDVVIGAEVVSDPEGAECAVLLNTVSCDTDSIPAGDTQTFTYTVTMPESFEGASGGGDCADGEFPVVNTVALADEAGESGDTVCVAAAPNFTIEKTANVDGPATPGQDVEYTITVTNTGSSQGSTTFTDDYADRLDPGEVTTDPEGGSCDEAVDEGNEILSCETGDIPAGESQTFTYTAAMPETFSGESGGGGCDAGTFPIENTVDLVGEGGTDSVTVCVAAAPAFTIEKSADDTTVAAGADVEYTITVTNSGSSNGSTSFTDDFDDAVDPGDVTIDPEGGSCDEAGGQLSCETGDIPAGESQTFTYTAAMPGSFTGESGGGGCETGEFPVVNTATLDGDVDDASVTVCVATAPAFEIEKSADHETATPEQDVEYTITVTNTGSSQGATSFTDDFDDDVDPGDVTVDPEGGSCEEAGGQLSCETGTIPAGGSQTFTYTAAMPKTFVGAGGDPCEAGFFAVTNTATLADDAGEDDATVCVEAAPDFTIDKTSDVEGTAIPGQDVEYTITVTNTGSSDGSATFVDDYADRLEPGEVTTDPEGGSCEAAVDEGNEFLSCETSQLDAGQSQTFTYTATMPETFTGESGAGGCADGTFPIVNDVDLNGGAANDTVTVCVAAAPAFEIEKSADADTANPEQDVEYSITVTNTGSSDGSTTFTDDFDDDVDPGDVTVDPEGGGCEETDGQLSCETGTIPAGESQTFTYTAAMPKTFVGESGGGGCETGFFPVTNTATLADDAGQDDATVCVAAAPDFDVDKTSDVEGTATPGQTVTYTITVTNTGTSDGSTTFVDDYADSLEPSLPVSDPEGGECSPVESDNESFSCETGTIPAGETQTFTYSATLPETFEGESGTGGCDSGTYPVDNTATLDGEAGEAGVTICVEASPELTVTKSADVEGTATPGQTVTYTIVVSNGGSAPGSTSFVDDFDDRLNPTTPEADSEGGSCEEVVTDDNRTFECESGSVPAGGVRTFTYTAEMPQTFAGASGDGGCAAGEYPVANSVTVGEAEPQTVTVCVTAAPDLELVKSVEQERDASGNEYLTYTITYTNNGPAEAPSALVNDEIPEGTVFEECSDQCETEDSPVSSATWAVGPIAADGGTGSVTLTVRVTTKEECQVTNVATIQFGLSDPVSSNEVVTNVTPLPDPDGAHANGNAKGAQVLTSGLIKLPPQLEQPISTAATSQNGLGGPQLDDESVLTLKVPGNGSILRADALRTTSASVVTALPAEARHTSTSEVAKVCIVPVAGTCTVEANTVRAVASTVANGGTASTSSAGSTIQNLKILGLATPVDLNQTTKIPLNALVFGPGSYVAINERSGPGGQPSAGLSNGTYSADLSVTMIHVKITGVLGLQGAEVIVGQATAHSDFPETEGCGARTNNTVSGHAFVAGLFTGPLLADLVQGYTQVSPIGGSETQNIADVKLPGGGGLLSAKVGASKSEGTVDVLGSRSSTFAEVAGDGGTPACLLRAGPNCVLSATAVRSASQSSAGAGGASSTDSGTTLLGFQIGGTPGYTHGVPPPNHTVPLPGIGFIILNEHLCDDGTTTSGGCSGSTHSGLTVRGVRVVVTVAKNLLGLQPGVELIIAEAHSDATYHPPS